MKLKATVLVLLTSILCLSEGLSSAQESTDFGVYMKAAEKNAVLFRGRRAFYYNIRYNGHCFWDTPDFKTGEVVYNGKHYYDVLLNIDACRGEVLVKNESAVMSIVLVGENIDWFSIAGSKFVRPSGKMKKSYPEGFYEILFEGEGQTLYKKVNKVFTSNTIYNNGSGIGYDDPNYDPKVINYFQYNAKYYLEKDGVVKKIGKGKARKIAGRV